MISETADIYIAEPVHLGHSQAGYIQPATMIKIKLFTHCNNSVGIICRSEYLAFGGDTAYDTLLDAENKFIDDPFFGCDIGNTVGHTYPQIDNRAGLQLHGCPSGYYFTKPRFKRLNKVDRYSCMTA